jgi:hypothetical protein
MPVSYWVVGKPDLCISVRRLGGLPVALDHGKTMYGEVEFAIPHRVGINGTEGRRILPLSSHLSWISSLRPPGNVIV